VLLGGDEEGVDGMHDGSRHDEAGRLSRLELDRRGFLRLGGTGLAGLGLAGLLGCGGDDEGGGGGASTEPVTLRWAMWSGSPDETKIWQGLADEVKRKHPNITVKLETTTFPNYWDKLQTQLASETQADILGMQAARMPGFAARGALQPMQEQIDANPGVEFKDFFPVIENGLSFRDEVHALAYDLGPPVLYYNRDVFRQAGVEPPPPDEPMSWEEFRAKARDLTDRAERRFGYVQSPTVDWLIPWIWSGGGDYMNADASASTLDSPESRAALQFLSDLWVKDRSAAPITDLANPNSGVERFSSGRVGMHMDGPWQIVNIRANSDFDWDVAPIPAGPAGSIGWANGSGFGISKVTKNADAAFKAISVITGKAALAGLTKAGRGYPARQSAVPIFEGERPPRNAGVVQRILNSEVGETRPYRATSTWQETDVMLTQELVPAVFLGKPSIDEAVASIKPKFDRLLARHKEIEERAA